MTSAVDPDSDNDGLPDASDPDDDNDGIADWADPDPLDAAVGVSPLWPAPSSAQGNHNWRFIDAPLATWRPSS
ncbi:hypothetical protein [Halochromatium glycolicum]|uniref:hypothetical protein n=1 Tax=Halochromatium glycolicum TaxID=85075 RepID=UPI00190AB5D3|nr:hypothetical protein [Halochromatium glycolicum]